MLWSLLSLEHRKILVRAPLGVCLQENDTKNLRSYPIQPSIYER